MDSYLSYYRYKLLKEISVKHDKLRNRLSDLNDTILLLTKNKVLLYIIHNNNLDKLGALI